MTIIMACTPVFSLAEISVDENNSDVITESLDNTEASNDTLVEEEEQAVINDANDSNEVVEEQNDNDNNENLEVSEENINTEEESPDTQDGDVASESEEPQEDPAEEEGVITISTPEELNAVRNDLSGSYKLIADIDLTSATSSEDGAYYNGGKGWTPIGRTNSNAFKGTFDGNGFSIIGLKISGSDTTYQGLFGCNLGTIKNLTLKDGSVSGNTHYAGGIAGGNRGTITDCKNYNTVNATGTYVVDAGGIVGTNAGTLQRCENHGKVTMMAFTTSSSTTGLNSTVGGISGDNTGDVSVCVNTGDVLSVTSDATAYAGGIIGNTTNSLDTCENSGGIVASAQGTKTSNSAIAGGITGYQRTGTVISNCWNKGTVSAMDKVGGTYAGGITGFVAKGKIVKCKNSKTVNSQSNSTSSSSYSGGMAGFISNEGVSDSISQCENDGTIIASSMKYSFSGGIAGGSNCGISGCFNTSLVASRASSNSGCTLTAGGIVGTMTGGPVADSFNRGTISSVGDGNHTCYTGGIAGMNGDTIESCYNEGKLTAIGYMGGIAGANQGTITDCYQAGTIVPVEGSTYYGGITGLNSTEGNINNIYSVGTLIGTRNYGGSLIGKNQGSTSGTVVVCDLGLLYTAANGDKVGKELYFEELEDAANFQNFDFSKTWRMGSGSYKLPVLVKCPLGNAQDNISIPIEGVYLKVFTPNIKYNGTLRRALVYASGLKVHTNYELSGGAVDAGNATVTVEGIEPFYGSVDLPFTIDKANISSASVSGIKNATYTGKAIQQRLNVVLDYRTLAAGTDYTVSYANNVNVGTATITITGKGNYTGSIKKTFKIATAVKTDLPSVKIKAPKKAKKAMTVKWTKLSKANQKKIGYIQIQYSTDKKFKTGVKTVTAKKTAASKKISKLTSKKVYYVRIRSYKKTTNIIHVSAWSTIKSVKVK